jgi:hypothetical protein
MPDWNAVLTRWLAGRRVDPLDLGSVIEELGEQHPESNRE